MKIIVSACLTGINCKYNGGNNKNDYLLNFLSHHEYITICPEVLGGLHVSRTPAERVGNRVINRNGEDVTEAYRLGAEESLRIAEIFKPDLVILQPRSPSCGVSQIYDGTFTGTLVDGMGVTAEMLIENGYKVVEPQNLSPLYL